VQLVDVVYGEPSVAKKEGREEWTILAKLAVASQMQQISTGPMLAKGLTGGLIAKQGSGCRKDRTQLID